MRHASESVPVVMTIEDVRKILDADVLAGQNAMDNIVELAFCADLMSDVLAFSLRNSLLVTGLTNAQAVRTAEVADIRAIVFVQNKKPDAETRELAAGRNIPLLSTRISMFEACGRLYENGLRGWAGSG